MFRPAKQHLLTLLFEANPLDGACDQRVVIDSQPLQIIYDAVSSQEVLLHSKHSSFFLHFEIFETELKGLQLI